MSQYLTITPPLEQGMLESAFPLLGKMVRPANQRKGNFSRVISISWRGRLTLEEEEGEYLPGQVVEFQACEC